MSAPPQTEPPTSQSSRESFTGARSVRYPAPDVARGLMLLLIALANVPFWSVLWRQEAEPTPLGTAWQWVRGGLVDARSYPLFALLFGFGLAVMARRRSEASTNTVLAQHGLFLDTLPPDLRQGHEAAIREAATVEARKLLRRRGWWMLLFGAVHALAFSGDIIGTYALIAVIFAGAFARRSRVVTAVVSGVVVLLCTAFAASSGWALATVPEASANAFTTSSFLTDALLSPAYPLVSLGMWLLGTIMTLLSSMVLPAAFLGAYLADTDLLTHPERHRRALLLGGLSALAIGAATSAPSTMLLGGTRMSLWIAVPALPLNIIGGLVGACGWLALLALWAGPGRSEPLRGARWLLASVGTRSMTAYVSQTVAFGLLYGGLALAGAPAPGVVPMALSSVLVWALIAAACAWMERHGCVRGPLERLLRWAVATSARGVTK